MYIYIYYLFIYLFICLFIYLFITALNRFQVYSGLRLWVRDWARGFGAGVRGRDRRGPGDLGSSVSLLLRV